ncbi:MAG: flagellar M-ring protein FliF [Alphaproteobacteria bacterium]|nr:flagellar M-ring protein FliF [Alphaproteobacteria bacterium]
MNSLTGFLNRLGLARVAAMVVVAVMLLGFFGFLMFRITTPQMAPIYTGLSFDDSAAIVSELNTMNVPYKLAGDGEAILVPRDQITPIRMSLAESGLPARGQVGYEVFDEQNTLGATSFVQNINKVRALEGELARTISSLSRVKSARVHLVLPERELFRREVASPSASIVLDVRGALSAGEIRAVRHLVAAAIEGLSPNAVSVVDTAGSLLASGAAGEGEAGMGALFQERVLSFENRMRTRIEEILSNVLGIGRVRVQVSAELDMNRMTRTEETFDPDGQVVRSAQTRELTNAATGASPGGGVSVANELPGAVGGNQGGGSSEQSSTTEETINYEISKSTLTEITESGSVKRLSVAVVVDGSYLTDGSGASAYQARPEAEMAQLLSLVRSAMGYDQTRGDQVEVINMQFAERPDLQVPAAQSGLFSFTRDDLFAAAEMAVTLLIALALLFFVVRPLVRRVLKPEDAPLALAAPAAAGTLGSTAGPADGGGAGSNAQPSGAGGNPSQDAWMEQASKMGEAQAQTVQRVGEMIGENPQQTSMIIRDWLNQAA